MNIYQTLFALYTLLEKEILKGNEHSQEFNDFVSGLDPYLWTDGKTADPSIYDDFSEFVKSECDSENFTEEKSYTLTKKFIEKLSEENDIADVHETFEKCSLWTWEQICEELKKNQTEKYKCACCGCYTMEEPSGSFEICPVCFWEDDKTQNKDPEYTGGANKVCLNEAKKNFAVFGACTESAVPFVRVPTAEEVSGIIHEPTDADFI